MEEEEVAVVRRPVKIVSSADDEEFDRELKKMMQESLEQRKIDNQARLAKFSDFSIPINLLRCFRVDIGN